MNKTEQETPFSENTIKFRSHIVYIQGANVSNILRGGSTHQNKKKKSNKHGSGNAHFLSSVHLFIVAKNNSDQYCETR